MLLNIFINTHQNKHFGKGKENTLLEICMIFMFIKDDGHYYQTNSISIHQTKLWIGGCDDIQFLI